MRILLDECVNPRVKRIFAEHAVQTAAEAGWRNLDDGPLLALMQGNYDVLVTIDTSMEFQQNVNRLDFGIVVVHVPVNRMEHYEPIADQLRAAAAAVGSGQVIHVHSPEPRHR